MPEAVLRLTGGEPIPFDLAGQSRFINDPKTIDTGNGTPPIVDMGAYELTGMVNPLDLTGDGVWTQRTLRSFSPTGAHAPGVLRITPPTAS